MKKTDVWAMGVTLYIFTYNRFPYEFRSNTDGNCMTEIDIMDSISSFHLNFPENGRKVSDDLKALLSMMLERDPTRRPEIGEIKAMSRFLNEQPTMQARYGSISSYSSLDSNASSGGLHHGFSSSSLLSLGSFSALPNLTVSLQQNLFRKPLDKQQESFKLAMFNT